MNARQVGRKIKSISNVKKITNAMRLVSAVKMKKAQQRALDGRPYQELLEEAIYNIVQKVDVMTSDLLKGNKASSNKKLIIVITSNKGLCGSFNVSVIRHIAKEVNKDNEFVTIGKKGTMLIASLGGRILADYSSGNLIDNVTAVFQLALEKYLSGDYSSISLAYNKFISTLRYDPVEKMLLPFSLEEIKKDPTRQSKNYEIEPDAESIMDSLLESFIEEQIRFAVVESEAGEHSARMIAMQNATDNANSVVYNLTLLKNKLRQQSITYELLDMITAKESVEEK